MSRVNQPVLQLLPARARSVGPSAGLLEGPEGGVVFVFGLATFGYASADLAGRRLAAVQLVTTKIAAVGEVASAFGVNEATLWRWKRAFGAGGVLGLVTERPGPRRASKLTTSLASRIVKLDATGLRLQQIAVATGVSTATVRVALGRVTPRDQAPVEDDVDEPEDDAGDAELIVLAAPVPRTADRVAARFGDLLEAPVVITEGAQLPLAGLLLALPALEMTGLLPVAVEVFPPMRKGFYGLRAGSWVWTGPRRSKRCAANCPSSPATAKAPHCKPPSGATTPPRAPTRSGSSTWTGTSGCTPGPGSCPRPTSPGCGSPARPPKRPGSPTPCLLYTSDAADDLTRVDLGGRRIIKKT